MPLTTRLITALALGLTGAAMCAVPASAEEIDLFKVTYSGNLTHHRTGHDTSIADVDWRRETDLKAKVVASSAVLEFRPESGKLPGPAPVTTSSVTGTDVEDTTVVTVDGGIQTASCVNDGQGFTSPGQVSFRKLGSDVEVTMRPFNTFQVRATCSGFSSASGIFDWSSGAPEHKFRFPMASLTTVDEIGTGVQKAAPCPVTANTEPTVTCTTTWGGRIAVTLVGRLESLEPKKQGNAGGKTAKVGKPRASVGRALKNGTVKVSCPAGCTGKISAYAVALAKKRANGSSTATAAKAKRVLLGKGKLKSPRGGGLATGKVAFDKKDRKAIRRLGAVEYRVKVKPTGGKAQSKRVLVAAR